MKKMWIRNIYLRKWLFVIRNTPKKPVVNSGHEWIFVTVEILMHRLFYWWKESFQCRVESYSIKLRKIFCPGLTSRQFHSSTFMPLLRKTYRISLILNFYDALLFFLQLYYLEVNLNFLNILLSLLNNLVYIK